MAAQWVGHAGDLRWLVARAAAGASGAQVQLAADGEVDTGSPALQVGPTLRLHTAAGIAHFLAGPKQARFARTAVARSSAR